MTSHSIERKVQLFLEEHSEGPLPFLLGFSGGEDSLALAHCLLALKVPFHIAHYDHGWREGSDQEAKKLQTMATSWGIPFHTKRSLHGNRKELEARGERRTFFEGLFQTGEFQALLLAHHREDQLETLLKRVFEGSHLTTLKGMLPITTLNACPVWRPLLTIPKEVILSYIEENHLIPIDDETNRDPKYLRSRMRTHLIPTITDYFGKEIAPSLFRLSQYAQELDSFLEESTKEYSETQSSSPFGIHWDFTPFAPHKNVLLRYVLKRFFEKKVECPSAHVIDRMIESLKKGSANQKVEFGESVVYIDRGHLFFLKQPLPFFPEEMQMGSCYQDDEWEWTITQEETLGQAHTGWRAWWKGATALTIPKGEYQILPPARGSKKKWNNAKVPAFLRSSLPVIGQKGGVVGDFLTGESPGKQEGQNQVIKICICKR